MKGSPGPRPRGGERAAPDTAPRDAPADTVAPPLGREPELRTVDAFLDRARDAGASLFLTGQPGVGKTRLLTAAAERAAALGGRVLWGTGAQYRADVSYGVLRGMLLPLVAGFNRLPMDQRTALMSALGLGTAVVPGRLVLNACLNLLRQEAEQRPLVLVVDDLQWVDPPSATALGFVARRLEGTRVGLIAASRPRPDDPFKGGGLPHLLVRPLANEAADALVRRAFPEMTPRVRHRLVAESRGNPLALLALPGVLSATQLSGLEAIPDVLPLTGHIEAAFAARIARLPEESRHTLLVLAKGGTGELRLLQQALPGEPVLDHLAAPERAKLVKVDLATRRVTFRHPLVRSAVVESCAHSDVRRVHQALAELFAYDPDRSAWHLAEATAGTDDRVAALLAEAAHRRLRRGDATGAMEALTRAAELSADGAPRSRRLAEGAYLAACVTGEPDSAARLLAESRRVHPEHGGSLHAAAARAWLLLDGEGDAEAAHAVLVAAIEGGDHGYRADRTDLVDALDTLMTVCWAAGREAFWPPLHTAIGRLRPAPPELLLLTSGVYPDPARTSPETRRRLARLIDRQEGERSPHHLVRVNSSAVYVDLFDGSRAAAWRVVENGRAGGAVGSALATLAHLCLDDFGTGRWDEADQLADEGLALARARGYAFLGGTLHLHKALVAAARGDESAGWWADELTRIAEARKAYGVARAAHHPRALAALGRGDHEAAYRHAREVTPAGVLTPGSPHAPWVALDLVEAAMRTGRTSEAAAHARAMREASLPGLSPRLAALTLAAEALVAPDERAADLYERAVSVPGADRWPFDHARVQLLYGERLRRMRATGEARSHLTAALGVLRRLGAAPWAARAARELRASGRPGPAETNGATGLASLTPQELEIAALAAEGLTNKQIGAKLYLSPRTVGTHLYRIFPKLGITSRAALRDALSRCRAVALSR